jgi:predicted transcriptional regulator
LSEKQRDKTSITNVAEKELEVTGQPQHVIRYSLRTLEQDGIIKPSAQGAMITDKVHMALGTLESTLDDMITTMTDLKKKLR